jgi:hypothetical protein
MRLKTRAKGWRSLENTDKAVRGRVRLGSRHRVMLILGLAVGQHRPCGDGR